MTGSNEVELKLEVATADRERLEAVLGIGSSHVRRLVATYFDTPRCALRKAGFSLRIRHDGGKRTQTLKAAQKGAAGLFARGEWECPVPGDTPLVDAVAEPLAGAVDRRTLARLAPRFVSDIRRATRDIEADGARFELALDQGEIRAGAAREPIFELELELRDGRPQALFDFARQIAGEASVRLGIESKSDRGYRLAAREVAKPGKATPLVLDATADAATAFEVIGHACLHHFRLNEALLLDAGTAEAVHQARVAFRRLRTAFTLFAPLIGDDSRARMLTGELRWLADELGDVRNLDVVIAGIADPGARMALARLREGRLAHVRAEVDSARTRLLVIDLVEWLSFGEWRARACRGAADFAADALSAHRKRFKRRAAHFAGLDDTHRHKLRIEAKKLRYATEFFGSLFLGAKARRRHAMFLDALETVQDRLGTLNDLTAGTALLARLGIDARLRHSGEGTRKRLLGEAQAATKRLLEAKRFW